MLVLLGFAVLAGAGTALSPCVLPVLPALLSAGGVGGRRRPLGIVLGLSVTFTVTIVGVAKVVDGVGLGSDPLRDVAIVVLLVFGVVLLVPDISDRIEAPLSRLARFGPKTRGDGFLSGLLVGGALGFVYTPCASPILAAVISVSAASGKTIVIAIAYALGSAVVLLALTLGGRRLFERVRKAGRGPLLQRALGTIMILTAVAIVTNLDVNFDQFVAQHIPDVNLTASLECSETVTKHLHEISGHEAKFAPANGSSACGGSASSVKAAPANASQATLLAAARGLKDLGAAPEFTETQDWFNTPGDKPLSLSGLRGRVVLVDFWTYTCINCIRTLPYLKAWDASLPPRRADDRRRRDAGVRVRARRVERVERDQAVRPALSGRPGQRHGHVERVRQRVLAGRLPDRRERQGALRDVRRGRLRQDRNGDPRAARRSRRRGRREEPPGRRRRAERSRDARDLPRHRARRRLDRRAARRRARLRTGAERTRWRSTSSRSAAAGGSAASRRRRWRAPASTSTSRPSTSTSCSAPKAIGRARCRCCSTASRSQRPTPAPTCTTRA